MRWSVRHAAENGAKMSSVLPGKGIAVIDLQPPRPLIGAITRKFNKEPICGAFSTQRFNFDAILATSSPVPYYELY
jgi:hypothetical protein